MPSEYPCNHHRPFLQRMLYTIPWMMLYEEKPYSLLLEKNMYLIKGFTQGLLGMCKGETRRIIVPSKLGYGKMGAAYIPGNTTLVYEVEMVKLENVKEDKK